VRRATLTLDAIAVGKSPIEAAATTTYKQLRKSMDCPDCYNRVIKFYDWSKTKYVCENCGLTIANYSILSTYIRSGIRDWKVNPVRLIFNTLVGTVLYGNHGVMN
jgi:transposase-like protein